MKLMRKPIEVIAWFDFQGNAVPIRLDMRDENQELQVVKVDKIIKDRNKFAGNSMLKYTARNLCTMV